MSILLRKYSIRLKNPALSFTVPRVSVSQCLLKNDCHLLVNGYGRNGMGTETVDLYEQMLKKLRNTITHICVLYACPHVGLIDEARGIFSEIDMKVEQIVATIVNLTSTCVILVTSFII